jgi:hypothetical protein
MARSVLAGAGALAGPSDDAEEHDVKTMSATTDIDAPPMAVWAVLTDLAGYPEWNPLFRAAAGEIEAGGVLTLTSVHPAGSGRTMTVKVTVLAAEPGVELRWTAGLKGIIGGEHTFALSAADDGTRLVQSETFGGLLVPLSGKVMARAQVSFRELNEAIKKRAESR